MKRTDICAKCGLLSDMGMYCQDCTEDMEENEEEFEKAEII